MASSALRRTFLSSSRTAMSPSQRLQAVQRQFSSSSRRPKEIQDAYIVSAVRTPCAIFNGSFSTVPAPELGATAIKEAIKRSDVPAEKFTHVYMGNVMQASVGQAPARQAAIFAGLSPSVEATTINKVCASGMKAVAIAAQQVELGQEEALIAGGMENMSRVPYYTPRGPQLPAFGNMTMEDGLMKDGLWDVYNQIHMGNCAENTAKKHDISREEQDEFAILSFKRAQEAWKRGDFAEEIVPVTVKTRKGETVVAEDEGYGRMKLDKVPTLKPAFQKQGGTVTAANSSSMNDGASALVITNKELAKQYGGGKRILAKIVAYADAAVDPIDFPVAPAKVVPIVLERAGITADQVKVWEFNEAFAAVIKANAKILGLGIDNVNPRGGAISLGHALGSSGARILVTLLHQLKKGEYGCAAICNGGGAASGMVVQLVDADEL
ncbi:Acetyl-CoA acetyltransferase, mitochondrial [Fulvia fulva]|uniref:acetyl-CoA C-acetyltransferase n=1 Tax=Passalora fulva TaxID=5499 RepID=A0A9Q8PHF1_PASFU|nr:Acetyl-CoA acetyltransferase, mitochondrial [Fulvia fulva]KAK4626846.1 Acetyl-CoA acetyltransferase, mitochondrial [Fulvia fulva]KAK4628286.1 Acetyl-CoA acetyltransferase, mitochondrial [Fulvia fulva]UJO22694.1 Acetyl-CoA acetyltransferase, mitochondrial [Fulvia fulva]WPV13943.1 Acetyl-CoA acetyltransferase, mitochondrial [Fulvia fulva]WPV29145.1 Acetyl-CoA acetyltransferase, mitochondrial [Fulvia fulva]